MSDAYGVNFQLVANGNINQSSFVKLDTSNDRYCLQAGVGSVPIGIAQAGSGAYPDGDGVQPVYAATSTSVPPLIFGPGDICPLTAGTGGWTRGNYLKPDANGYGIVCNPGELGAAYALSSASAGDRAEVFILFPPQQITNLFTSSAVDIALTAAMSRQIIKITAADKTATLPAISTLVAGWQITVVSDLASAGSVGTTIAINAADTATVKLYAPGITAAAGKGVINTFGTSKQGDNQTIYFDGTHFYTLSSTGTWARVA